MFAYSLLLSVNKVWLIEVFWKIYENWIEEEKNQQEAMLQDYMRKAIGDASIIFTSFYCCVEFLN